MKCKYCDCNWDDGEKVKYCPQCGKEVNDNRMDMISTIKEIPDALPDWDLNKKDFIRDKTIPNCRSCVHLNTGLGYSQRKYKYDCVKHKISLLKYCRENGINCGDRVQNITCDYHVFQPPVKKETQTENVDHRIDVLKNKLCHNRKRIEYLEEHRKGTHWGVYVGWVFTLVWNIMLTISIFS